MNPHAYSPFASQDSCCPHCLHPVARPSGQDIQFELCSRCDTLWLDFGPSRPKLHRAVEAQAERWDNFYRLIRPETKLAG